jgi:hypothetical protein
VNSAKGSLRVIRIARVLCAKTQVRASAGAFSPRHRLTWASFQPNTVHYFPFSLSARLRKSIEKYRKMIKI